MYKFCTPEERAYRTTNLIENLRLTSTYNIIHVYNTTYNMCKHFVHQQKNVWRSTERGNAGHVGTVLLTKEEVPVRPTSAHITAEKGNMFRTPLCYFYPPPPVRDSTHPTPPVSRRIF